VPWATRVALRTSAPDLRRLLERAGVLVEHHVDDPDLPDELAVLMKRRGYRSCFGRPAARRRRGGWACSVWSKGAPCDGLTDTERTLPRGRLPVAALGVGAAWTRRVRDEHAEHLMTLVESSHTLGRHPRSGARFCLFHGRGGATAAARRRARVGRHIWQHQDDGSFTRASRQTSDGPPWRRPRRRAARYARPQGDRAPPSRPGAHRRARRARLIRAARRRPAKRPDTSTSHGQPLRRFTADELAVLQVLGDHARRRLGVRRASAVASTARSRSTPSPASFNAGTSTSGL